MQKSVLRKFSSRSKIVTYAGAEFVYNSPVLLEKLCFSVSYVLLDFFSQRMHSCTFVFSSSSICIAFLVMQISVSSFRHFRMHGVRKCHSLSRSLAPYRVLRAFCRPLFCAEEDISSFNFHVSFFIHLFPHITLNVGRHHFRASPVLFFQDGQENVSFLTTS